MITVDMLLKMPALQNLKVVAGESGLGREVRSVSVMDAPDSHKWLRGGEFILTTGYLVGGDEQFLELYLINLLKANSSALGVKKGRYLRKIPDSVISFANQQHFPIIEIPYTFGWSEIISVFYELLYSGANGGARLANVPSQSATAQASRNALLYERLLLALTSETLTPQKIHDFEKQRGYETTLYTGVLLIRAVDSPSVYADLQEMLAVPHLARVGKTASFYFKSKSKDEAVVILEIEPMTDETPDEWLRSLFEEMEYCLVSARESYLAASRLSPRLDDIVSCYQEAKEAYEIGLALWQDRHCFLYSLLSVYSVLQNAMPDSVDFNCIEILEKQQYGLSFDAIASLETYIEAGSFRKAAEKLFIHENTLRYRIQKIGELLHLDLDDPVVMHSLITQIKLWRLRKRREEAERARWEGNVPQR
jgi:purine catabolism regulator